MFLHDCANVIWNLKGPKGFHLSTLITFLCQKISITLQRMQASSILSRTIVVGLVTFSLPLLQNTSHHQGQSIASCWFLTYKYGWPTIGDRLWTRKFSHLLLTNLMSCHFSLFPLFYSFVHFSNLTRVFFNKALLDFDDYVVHLRELRKQN